MIYSARTQPEVDKSCTQEVPKINGLIFHMDEVSDLWRKTLVNNSHVFILSNCSVLFKLYEY